MKLFKIRCSSISKIMAGQIGLTEVQEAKLSELSQRKADPMQKKLTLNMEDELTRLLFKQANPELPQGAKSYCEQWFLEKKYNRRKEWYSNKIEKGLQVEPIGIKMLSALEGQELSKNDEWFSNDFIEGTPDLIYKPVGFIEEIVTDIKSSWDIFTFPWFDKTLPDEQYDWQVQGYLDLTGLNKGSINYCLIDTPNPIIQLELKKLYFQSGGLAEEWSPEINIELAENFKFGDIPVEDRMRKFLITKDEQKIKSIYARVALCRTYIAGLERGVDNPVGKGLE